MIQIPTKLRGDQELHHHPALLWQSDERLLALHTRINMYNIHKFIYNVFIVYAGAFGATGPAGPTGPAGLTGLVGVAGQTGAVGPAGPAGPTGPTGLTGPVGSPGADGPQGKMFIHILYINICGINSQCCLICHAVSIL